MEPDLQMISNQYICTPHKTRIPLNILFLGRDISLDNCLIIFIYNLYIYDLLINLFQKMQRQNASVEVPSKNGTR